MTSTLNIRDIGAARKAALHAEAKRRGVSVAEVVRKWIDAGIARSTAERARAEWIAAARDGVADEARRLREKGPTRLRLD